MSGTLWIVATPIGNLEDITLRALRVLREADMILAEDTRRTKTLLTHHGLGGQLSSLHAHTSPGRIEALADELAQGKRFALVTDAGTPLVSDPGRELIEAAIARDVHIEAVPGASAVLTALCVAGLHAEQFRFVGFLPRSGRRRREALNAIAHDRATCVLFESPKRVRDTLQELRALCGDERRAAVCRELTKLHEQVARGTFESILAQLDEEPRGEVTLVIEGVPHDADDDEESDAEHANVSAEIDVSALLDARAKAGVSAKDVAKELATLLDIDKREAYRRVVEHRMSKA